MGMYRPIECGFYEVYNWLIASSTGCFIEPEAFKTVLRVTMSVLRLLFKNLIPIITTITTKTLITGFCTANREQYTVEMSRSVKKGTVMSQTTNEL